jgi:pilus assembly protein Flp/PilA
MNFTNGSMRILQIVRIALNWKIWRDSRGQDLIEYSLMAGFVTVAAGALVPGVASSINLIFSQVNTIMIAAASN